MKQNLKLLLTTLLVCVLITEIAFRINGKYISYAERTGGEYSSPFNTGNPDWTNTVQPFEDRLDEKKEFTTRWKANNEGLNNPDIALKKTAKRVMVFGDSFVEGVGAPNDSSYPRILEKLLQASSDTALQVINCGISGADIFTGYQLLVLKMAKYQPDYVVICLNSSDFFEFEIRGGFERFAIPNQLQYRPAPWFEGFYKHSFIARRIVHDVYHYDYSFLQPQQKEKIWQRAHQQMAQAIDSFSAFCLTRNIKMAIVFQPMFSEVAMSIPYPLQPELNYCKQTGVIHTDERAYLNQQGIDSATAQTIYWKTDTHFNASGYRYLALCTYQLFRQQSWLVNDAAMN